MTKAVTLLHGFMGAPSDWDQVSAELSNIELATPSIRPAADWAQGVEELLDELPDRSVFVGYSMGARLLLACALEEPWRCEGLVFVSGNPGLDEEARGERRRRDLEIAARIEKEPRRDFLRQWYSQAVFASLSEQMAGDEIERRLAQQDAPWADILRTYSVSQQPNYWSQLGDLPCPILAVAGQRDDKYTDIVIRMSKFTNCQARVVAAAGHIVHREQPYVFVQMLREFFKGLADEVPSDRPLGSRERASP